MSQNFFVKQTHKDIKCVCSIMYIGYFCILMIKMIMDKKIYLWIIVFLSALLVLLLYLAKVFESYGIYINNDKLYYKTIRKREIDISTIVGIKIIKTKGQVDISWSPFDLKDTEGNNLYTMIFLSEIKDNMRDYPYGDIDFMSIYKEEIIMYSTYDERLIDFLKERSILLEIL